MKTARVQTAKTAAADYTWFQAALSIAHGRRTEMKSILAIVPVFRYRDRMQPTIQYDLVLPRGARMDGLALRQT